MAKFQKGHKLAKGGKRLGAGRPTREQAAEKQLRAETAAEIIKANEVRLAQRLIDDAMSEKGRKSLHVAINKITPDAKQDIKISGSLIFKSNVPEVKP